LYETGLKSQQNKPSNNQIRLIFSILWEIHGPTGIPVYPDFQLSSRTIFSSAEPRENYFPISTENGCLGDIPYPVPNPHVSWTKTPNPKAEFSLLKRLIFKGSGQPYY
jgi:hypothetical protein